MKFLKSEISIDPSHSDRLSSSVIKKQKQNRNLPYRIAEADRGTVRPRRVPRKQRGGHQCSAHHGRPEGEQTAVLPEPVTHCNPLFRTGSIIILKSVELF